MPRLKDSAVQLDATRYSPVAPTAAASSPPPAPVLPAHLQQSPFMLSSLPPISTNVDGITRQFYGSSLPVRRTVSPGSPAAKTQAVTQVIETVISGGNGGGGTVAGIQSINADTTPAQQIVGGAGPVTVTTANGITTVSTPAIPAAQVNSDWNASSGVAMILNKPIIPPAFSGALSALTAAVAANTINNASFPQIWNWALTGASIGMTIGEASAGSGTGSLVRINALSSGVMPLDVRGISNTSQIRFGSTVNAGYLTAAGGGGVQFSAGASLSLATYIAQGPSAATLTMNATAVGSFYFYGNSGLTAGNSFTPTVLATLGIPTINPAGFSLYAAAGANIHTFYPGSGNLNIAGCASHNGTSYVAAGPTATILAIGSGPAGNGGFSLNANTGLTVGVGFTPTLIFSIDGVGNVAVTGNVTATGSVSCRPGVTIFSPDQTRTASFTCANAGQPTLNSGTGILICTSQFQVISASGFQVLSPDATRYLQISCANGGNPTIAATQTIVVQAPIQSNFQITCTSASGFVVNSPDQSRAASFSCANGGQPTLNSSTGQLVCTSPFQVIADNLSVVGANGLRVWDAGITKSLQVKYNTSNVFWDHLSVGVSWSNFDHRVMAVGWHCRSGTAGVFTGTVFNIDASLQLWIEATNHGVITVTSDYRVKANIESFGDGALGLVKQLRVVEFDFIDPPDSVVTYSDGVRHTGFLAHEVGGVFPSGCRGEKDALTVDGKIQPQTISQLDLLALLTKAVQELSAKVEKLEVGHGVA